MGLTPEAVENMTLDQIHALACDKKRLASMGRLVKGSAKDLEGATFQGGSLRGPGGKTLLQVLREEKAAKEAAELRKSKKVKRREARERALAYKRSLLEEGA